MESDARDVRRWAVYPLTRTTAPEAQDVAVWLIDHDPVFENQSLGARVLCQINSAQKDAIFRRLLAQPHPNESVVVMVLEQVTLRRLGGLAPEVRQLTSHYREAVRTAAETRQSRWESWIFPHIVLKRLLRNGSIL